MMVVIRRGPIGELIQAARLGRRGLGGCLSHAHMSGPTRSPSPEDEQAGDEHRLHEAHPPAGLSALTGVREKGLCSCVRPPSGSYMIIHVSFLNEIVTDFRSNWFCRFGGEVAG